MFVTVGTDHHPFDRLVRWTNDWVHAREGDDVRVLVQTGTASTPSLAPGVPMLAHDGMRRYMDEASVLVTHGGTATILEARHRGLIPIVVPRRAALREHVDDHQVAFAARLARQGEARVAEDEDRFRDLIEECLRRPERFRRPSPTTTQAVALFREAVRPLIRGSTRVLYIGGMGRSGTTLLERMVGQAPGFVSAGELLFLWERGLLADELCGCGLAFSACPFWQEVGRRAYGGWGRLEGREVADLRARVDRQRFVALMAAPRIAPSYQADLGRLADLLRPLYEAIAEVGGGVVVDSSKHASYAYLLRRVPGLGLRVVHVVRDSRGVAHSMAKRVRRPEGVGPSAYMAAWGPATTSAHWVAHNALLDLLPRLGVPTTLVRYEQLVRAPRDQLGRILAFARPGVAPGDLGFIQEHAVQLGVTHGVSGNPMRFRQGLIPLRLDEAWRERMPARRRALVTATTLLWLIRYGYARGIA